MDKSMHAERRLTRKKLVLPDYTHGEEIFNMVTHIVGAALGIIICALCLYAAIRKGDAYAIVTSAVYGFAGIVLFTISSVYHGLHVSYGKLVMRVIDHCTIYILIAGTYTPILLVSMRPEYPAIAWSIFGVVWALTALSIVLNAVDLQKYKAFAMFCYILMGWCIIFALKPAIETIGLAGFWWLLAGGVAYTIGAILYGIGRKKRYFHSVFHIFVDIGYVLQAVCILQYVLN